MASEKRIYKKSIEESFLWTGGGEAATVFLCEWTKDAPRKYAISEEDIDHVEIADEREE